MIYTLLFVSAMSAPIIDLPAGYYSINDFAEACSKQGLSVQANPDCATDTYVASIHSQSWDQLRKALESDERLVVTEKDGTWTIARSAISQNAERAQFSRYWNAIIATTKEIYVQAAADCRAISELTNDQQDEAAEKYRARSLQQTNLLRISSNIVDEMMFKREMMYSSVGWPDFLCRMEPTLSYDTWYVDNLLNTRLMFDPKGNLRKLPYFYNESITDEKVDNIARTMKVAAKWIFEPSTATLGTIFALQVPPQDGRSTAEVTITDNIFPKWLVLEIPYIRVIVGKESTAYAARSARTDELMSKVQQKANLAPNRRLSSHLLTWATENNKNLIAYVSPFTDLMGASLQAKSLAELLQSFNARDYVEPKINDYMHRIAQTDVYNQKQGGVVIPKRFTLAEIDGTYVVRNELRFMDGICVSPTVPSTQIMNTMHAGKIVKLADLAKVVNELKIGSWKSSNFSKQYFDLCDPVAFKPFAAAMAASPVFQSLVESAKLGSPATIDLLKLDPVAQQAFKNAITEVATKFDFRYDYDTVQLDPRLVRERINTAGLGGLKVQVRLAGDVINFEIIADEGSRLWLARITKASLK